MTHTLLYTEMNLKWIIDIKVKWKIIKCSEKHLKKNICNLRFYEDKLHTIQN